MCEKNQSHAQYKAGVIGRCAWLTLGKVPICRKSWHIKLSMHADSTM